MREGRYGRARRKHGSTRPGGCTLSARAISGSWTFDFGALLRSERTAVALLKPRDLLLDRLEAEVVCENACAVTSRGLRIGDLGTRCAQLLTARIGSQ